MPTPPGGRPPRRPKRHTVKRKDTYASLAEKYNVPEQDLIQGAGVKKLTAGQVIPLPPMPTVGPVPPAVPDLPGYGGTAEDLRARGAVVTGQQDVAGFEAFRAQERQVTNDAAIVAAFEAMQPGARGPQADALRKQYLEIQARTPKEPGVAEKFFTGELIGPQSEEERLERRAADIEASEATLAEPWQYFKWWITGQGQQIDPVTGKVEDVTPAPDKTQGDVLREQANIRRAEEMQEYYANLAEANAPRVDAEGREITPTVAPEYGEPYAVENYPRTDSQKNYSDGENVYYNGRVIPQNEFLEFLDANRTEYKDLTEMMESEEGQRQLFVQGSKLTLRAVHEALKADDRNMLPDILTPAQLALMGSDRDWDDYMRNVLNYRWDAEKGAWIKQEEDDNYPAGDAAGYGGGYAGFGAADDWVPGSGQTQQGGTGKNVRADIRFAQNVGGIAQIHWRV